MKELDLGTGNIGSLIKRYSIPCVISMVVAALYNIVDQIFIGWSIWNAATNIVYPFTVLALGLALLVGDGAAAGFSIALGKGDKKQANKNVGNGLVILFCLALGLCAIGFKCQTQIWDYLVAIQLKPSAMVQTATFCGQQGRISRPVRAILSGRL